MKSIRNSIALTSLVLIATLNPQLSTVFAQGSLTPTGAPAPTMKTLQQVEPRKPISSLPYSITNSGSYYLTATVAAVNLSDGITISVSNVTLDLKGFTLKGVPGSGDGIRISGSPNNVTLRNGIVDGWGGNGVDLGSAVGTVVEDIHAFGNGDRGVRGASRSLIKSCVARGNFGIGISASDGASIIGCISSDNVGSTNSHGFSVFNGSRFESCAATGNGGAGFRGSDGSSARDCAARDNGSHGFDFFQGNTVSGALVEKCVAHNNSGSGIMVGAGGTVADCAVTENRENGIQGGVGSSINRCSVRSSGLIGIDVLNASSIRNCAVSFSTGDGIEAGAYSSICDNQCYANGNDGDGAGIHITNVGNRVEGNHVVNNDRGIDVDLSGNLIIRNSARGNTTEYTIVAGNSVGPILTSATIGANTHPQANFDL